MMNWYVKYESSGKVSGPMTHEKALYYAEAADGVMFNERIFEPQFVTTPEVEELIGDVKRFFADVTGVSRPPHQLEKRIIDMITLLSREPIEVDSSVAVLVAELQRLREAKEIIRNGENDSIGVLLKQVMDAMIFISREKLVTGTIEGGVLSLDDIPAGVTTDIRDYDVQGVGTEDLKTDENGHEYFNVPFTG